MRNRPPPTPPPPPLSCVVQSDRQMCKNAAHHSARLGSVWQQWFAEGDRKGSGAEEGKIYSLWWRSRAVTGDVLQWWGFYHTQVWLFLRHQRAGAGQGEVGAFRGDGSKEKRAEEGKVQATFWAGLHHSTSTVTSLFLYCSQSHLVLLSVIRFLLILCASLTLFDFPRMMMALTSVPDQEIFY